MTRKGSGRLLKDGDVKRWYENMAAGSVQTAQVRLRALARLCREMGTSPEEIVSSQSEGNGFEDELMDFLQAQRREGRLPGYLKTYVVTVRSWLQYNGQDLRRRIKVGNTQATPTLEDERIPTREELRDVFMAATPRGRVVVSLIAFSGLRPSVMGNFRGTDGLRLRDLEDLDLRKVRFARIPALVRVRPELSKVSHPYLTFLSEEGAEHVRRYLEMRVDQGEDLEPDAPLVRCAPGFEVMGKREGAHNHGSPFVVAGNVRGDVKAAMEKAGYGARPYVLRRYFETQLFNASWKGHVPRDWITFWAGHKGDIEHVYTLHKGLPSGLVEEMREAYGRASPYLSTVSLIPESSYEVRETEGKITEELKRLVEAEVQRILASR